MSKLKSVLIVDDNEGDHFITEKVIKRSALCDRVFHEVDGTAALAFLTDFDSHRDTFGDEFPPTLILLDINMPKMNGFEFLEAYRTKVGNDPNYRSVVVMMFTSSENEEDRARVMAFDFVKGFIVKPLNVAKLTQCVNEYL